MLHFQEDYFDRLIMQCVFLISADMRISEDWSLLDLKDKLRVLIGPQTASEL